MPELRFPEFQDSENWKGCLLGEVASFSKGKGISKSDVTPDGKLPCIRYGQLYTHYKETIKEVISYTNLPLEELVLSKPNDVIIPASGETQLDIATASCIKKSGVALGGDLNIIRSKHDGVFLAYYLNSAKKNSIAQMAQGIAVVHLYANQLKNLEINLPEINEQQKIADCLSSLDELISAHTQKFDTLKAHKKGLMQQLFPAEGETVPKLRFPEFQGEWRKTQLKKLGELVSGLTYSPADVRDSGLLVLRSSNVKNGIISLKDNVYVTPNVKGANLSKANDILICVRNGSKALIGKNALIPEGMPVCTHGAFMTVFRSPSAKFVFQLFQTNAYQKQVDADLGATINSINGRHFINYEFYVPESFEQQKIADCLSSIDELITAQSHKIDTLKVHKQGLMQQLFPTVGGDCIDAEDRATQNAEVEVSA